MTQLTLVLLCLSQQDLSLIMFSLRGESKNPVTTITTNSISRVVGLFDPPLEKCQCRLSKNTFLCQENNIHELCLQEN